MDLYSFPVVSYIRNSVIPLFERPHCGTNTKEQKNKSLLLFISTFHSSLFIFHFHYFELNILFSRAGKSENCYLMTIQVDCFARGQRLRFFESILKTSFQKCFKKYQLIIKTFARFVLFVFKNS